MNFADACWHIGDLRGCAWESMPSSILELPLELRLELPLERIPEFEVTAKRLDRFLVGSWRLRVTMATKIHADQENSFELAGSLILSLTHLYSQWSTA
jgi:hypothetical protein